MNKIQEFTERAVHISQAIRDLSADMIAEGDKFKYGPADLSQLDDAITSIEGRTKLLNEALFELGIFRWTRRLVKPRPPQQQLGPVADK